MKISRHPADVAILTVDAAWENYCNALHLSRTAMFPGDRAEWTLVARWSLDVYFARLERKRDAFAAIWEPWG
jgi:hypothetical protein